MKVELKLDDATMLLRVAFKVKWPAQFLKPVEGAEKAPKPSKVYTEEERARINEKIRQLFRNLKRHSDLYQEEGLLWFGPKSMYDIRERSEEERHRLSPEAPEVVDKLEVISKDPHAVVPVEISRQARDGLFYLLVHLLHPAAEGGAGAGQGDQFFDYAEQIKAVLALEREIGLKRNDQGDIPFDDEKGEGSESDAKPEAKEVEG
jgi:hypothetical protein